MEAVLEALRPIADANRSAVAEHRRRLATTSARRSACSAIGTIPTWLRTLTNLSPENYLKVLANTACAVGNSSSFVRDAGYFGTPVVLVGNRQEGREHDVHVTPTLPVADEIEAAVRRQLAHGRYAPSTLYGDGHVSERIAEALVRLTPYVQKRLHFPYEQHGRGRGLTCCACWASSRPAAARRASRERTWRCWPASRCWPTRPRRRWRRGGWPRVVLSTDDEEIAAVGRQLGLEVPFMRPAELARDDTPTLPVVQDVVRRLEADGDRYDAIFSCNRRIRYAGLGYRPRALKLLESSDADSVVTMLPVPDKFNPHWVYFQDDAGELRLSTGESNPISRRQDLPTAFHREGSVYVTRRDVLMEKNSLFGSRLRGDELDRCHKRQHRFAGGPSNCGAVALGGSRGPLSRQRPGRWFLRSVAGGPSEVSVDCDGTRNRVVGRRPALPGRPQAAFAACRVFEDGCGSRRQLQSVFRALVLP